MHIYVYTHTRTHANTYTRAHTFVCRTLHLFHLAVITSQYGYIFLFIIFFQNTNRAGASVANSYPWKALELDKLAQVFFF
jgi:hypothetical protein